jgi:translation initiation factor 1
MNRPNDNDRRIVYSTGCGSICPECGNPVSSCRCGEKKTPAPKGDGVIRVRRETKGRGGKTMTTISGAPLDGPGLEELASKLKRRLGTGGAVKDGVIEIQGDRVETVIAELAREGFKAKRSGG